jgi:hypothetical protein
MTDSRVALGMDRLPWLPDEPAPRARPARTAMPDRIAMLGWVVAAMLVVAGLSYWLGLTNRGGQPEAAAPSPEATFRLPDVSEQAPPAAAQPTPAPTRIEPMVAPPITIVESQRPVREVPQQTAPEPPATAAVTQEAETTTDQPAADSASSAPEAAPPPPPPAKPVYTGPWPARVVEGASGRLVRIGTFRTSRQAKKGWWAIVKLNPALKRLPALVVPVQSHRNGQVYYRLQMGTTSQAHSAVLCQRMRMVGQSCVIIDERRA